MIKVLLSLPLLALAAQADDIQTITISTPPGQMKYDRPVIIAAPGSQVKIVFQNNDAMPHNIVFCRPKDGASDKGLEVAMEAWKLAEKGEAKGWIPDHPRIWAHSGMVKVQSIHYQSAGAAGHLPLRLHFPWSRDGDERRTAGARGGAGLSGTKLQALPRRLEQVA